MTKNVSILGSTGSIGRQTLEVVEQLPIKVVAMTAGTNVPLMVEQCKKFKPGLAVMATEQAANEVLSLPMFNGITEEEITRVIDAVNAFHP